MGTVLRGQCRSFKRGVAMSQLAQRDTAEIERSANEAAKITLEPVKRSQVQRYRNPPSDSAFTLEYAFSLLGDIRGKTVLDLGCGTGENVIPLTELGARVVGIDISPELIMLAQLRLLRAGLEATVQVGRLRSLLPLHGDVSEYEHPLTRAEFAAIIEAFNADCTRYFRLPFVPLLSPIIRTRDLMKIDRWCIQRLPATSRYATCVVTRLSSKCGF